MKKYLIRSYEMKQQSIFQKFSKVGLAATIGLSLCLVGCTKSATEIQLGTVGDTMAFDKTALEVKAGATVKLTLKNNATSPAMQHDFVLVKPGTENDVGAAGIAAGPTKNYIPDSPNVLAHTKILKPGESETITFTAPSEPGNYPYICTFPGHYAVMKGVLKVI
jgi:azurin